MPFYRLDLPDGTTCIAHFKFSSRKHEPKACVAPDDHHVGERCGRMAVALCDHPAGVDLANKPLTCDAPMCEKHRTRVGKNRDYCPRHAKQGKLEL